MASSSGQKVEDLCQILCPKYLDSSDPGSKKHGLPINQPKFPREWDAESWDNRYMRGSAKIHIFLAGENRRKSFVLKVSDTTDSNGNKDLDPASRALAPALVALDFMASSHLEWQKSFNASMVPREGGEPDVVDCLHCLRRLSC